MLMDVEKATGFTDAFTYRSGPHHAKDESRDRATREWATAKSPDNWARLGPELDQIRRDGLAYDINEHTDGICAVGVAFRALGGGIHAISVPVPATRFDRERERVTGELRKTVKRIKQLLGEDDRNDPET